eukprot:scaffold1965_cov110-Cylindrotheca_fusiformis.AAC.5
MSFIFWGREKSAWSSSIYVLPCFRINSTAQFRGSETKDSEKFFKMPPRERMVTTTSTHCNQQQQKRGANPGKH